jgi:endonuclease-8
MPEGDSIFRAARTLDRALAGARIARFESMFPALNRVHEDEPLTGRTVESVQSIGKHILMRFSGDLILRTHMRMNGSWHIYRPGERWRRPRRDMRIVLATTTFEAIGFNIPVAELITEQELRRHDELRQLGPDLLGKEFDAGEAFARARERSSDSIGDVLLNQRVMAGVGNVYKSEVLFACGVNPFRPVSELTDAELRNLIATARRFLQMNVTPGVAPMTTYTGYRRTTGGHNPAERLWVYSRARRPCRKCGTSIEVKPQGPNGRLTYWCKTCQL